MRAVMGAKLQARRMFHDIRQRLEAGLLLARIHVVIDVDRFDPERLLGVLQR